MLNPEAQKLLLKLSNHLRAASYSERKNGKWIAEKRKNRKFIFPVAAMKKIFKGFFMHHIRNMYKQKIFAALSATLKKYSGKGKCVLVKLKPGYKTKPRRLTTTNNQQANANTKPPIENLSDGDRPTPRKCKAP